MKHLSTVILSILIFNVALLAQEQLQVRGKVLDLHTGEAIAGVEIFNESTGTVTNEQGEYELDLALNDRVTVRRIGYGSLSIAVRDLDATILLKAAVLKGQSIHVEANRAIPGITPIAFSTLETSEIRERYTVEDVPMILSTEAGVHAYSESGNGTGYSYVSIRGFDQSRIAVMLDNVPLNDNESHQVYWVDHGDILSSAEDVEIQRGIGSSLYGANAFGGSININTGISSENESIELGLLHGSYNTEKYRVSYKSGDRLGENLSLAVRASILNSDGYRVDSRSEQEALSIGVEHRSNGMVNQLRGIIGKEFSILQWDGVSKEYLDNPELRRTKMGWTVPFTDDFLQQIYSLNTRIMLSDNAAFRNVAYLVKGVGYYEVEKHDQDYFSYNLDVKDAYPDSVELTMDTDFTRRKWIDNIYYGITPTFTYESGKWRSDIGLELRKYTGDHYGEVLDVADATLASVLPDPYRYYAYIGEKTLTTLFAHLLYQVNPKLSLTMDLRSQWIDWNLNQEVIGHAPGVDLDANWQFFNPRVGVQYELKQGISAFLTRGTASREPADAQIIEADDVWSTPNPAESEQVVNTELGLNWFSGTNRLNLNLYRIEFQNELLSDIYDFQEGGFDAETADLTLHQGVEIDLRTRMWNHLDLSLNASVAEHRRLENNEKGNHLANVPGALANMHLGYNPVKSLRTSLAVKHVGKQYIDQANTEDIAIPAYTLLDLLASYKVGGLEISFKLNNVLDEHYATFGYEYYGGYYWPGATRNHSLGLNYSF